MRTLVKLLICIVLVACSTQHPKPKPRFFKINGEAQGTTWHITYEYADTTSLKPKVDSLLTLIDNSLSIYNPNAIISRINNNDTSVVTDSIFNVVFRKSEEVYQRTNGDFDITVAPIVMAYGFGPERRMKTNQINTDSLLKLVGMQKVTLKGHKIIKENKHVRIDVNGIAQGYSVDFVCQYFDKLSIKNYMVEIGGELRVKGRNARGEEWRIGIDKPIDGNDHPGQLLEAVICLSNKSVTTAGSYRKFFIEKGVKYSHTINPHTGKPAQSRLLSATVVASDCITADAYDTALMVMGLEKSIAYLHAHPELDAYLIYSDNKGAFCDYATSGLKRMMR